MALDRFQQIPMFSCVPRLGQRRRSLCPLFCSHVRRYYVLFAERLTWKAKTVYLILSSASAFFFTTIFTINLVYQLQVAHLNPLQLVLVGTVLEITLFLTQVPTGVLADVYSRRLAVIVGLAVIGVGALLEGSIPQFWAILLAQVLWGVGITLMDGAGSAWIADEVGEAQFGPLLLRSSQVSRVCELVAIPLSVALASVRLNLPVLLGGGLFVALAVLLLVVMPERGSTLLSLGVTEVIKRRLNSNRHPAVANLLFAFTACLIASILSFALAGNFWVALVAICCANVFRNVQEPIFRTWQVQRIDPAVRATVLSIDGQVNALGQIAGGPAVGAIGNLSLRAALVVAGLALSPALLLLVRARGQDTAALVPEETTLGGAVPLEEALPLD